MKSPLLVVAAAAALLLVVEARQAMEMVPLP
jgi:hypothetical protein